MTQDLFNKVDHYIDSLFVPDDSILTDVLDSTRNADMPQIQVSASQGKFLYLLAKLINAKRILELGTLAGYSSIWMARALSAEGRLLTLEYSEKHAKVARSNLQRAGLEDRVEVMVGPALETLPQLAARGEAPFDMVFIDADKNNYPAYLDLVVKLTRPGGLVLADNVVRAGSVLAPDKGDTAAEGARLFNEKLANHPRLEAVVLQLVGEKGHDGLAIARVKA
ncbi:O-methyltransferase [Dongia soli]|uniref:O-methyltransferase n=1 Tax=Dongia soli TaxID=600628 RepID=A0ABU5E9J8_9PROT|nr:O-methyltransferase [Dongia soli]MDY0882724.1 O-methyltransferase [Dongia soli]